MKQGDYVLVRCYGDKTRRVRVWEHVSGVVFVCSDENYDRLSRGVRGLWPVGFHEVDVTPPAGAGGVSHTLEQEPPE